MFSISRREYDRDDIIPTLNPEKIPKGVFNVFEGLAITYNDCKDSQHDVQPLLDVIKESLCNNDDAFFNFYIKWLARPLQGVETGELT